MNAILDWNVNGRRGLDLLGYIPQMVLADDPRPAREQLHERYAHGGGWQPFEGFTLRKDRALTYPGDPPLIPVAFGQLRDEMIYVYESGWVAIVQPDGTFEASRMD